MSIEADFKVATWALSLSPFEWVVCEALQRRHHLAQGSLFIIDFMDKHLSMIQRHKSLRDFFPVHEYMTVPNQNEVYLIDQFEKTNQELFDIWSNMIEFNATHGAEFYEGFVATDRDSKYQHQLQSPSKTTDKIQKYRFI